MTDIYHRYASTRCIDLAEISSITDGYDRMNAAIVQLASGKAVVLTDRVDNPRSGELVIAASLTTTSAAAFAIRHSSGLLQVALPSERCDSLVLPNQTGTAGQSRQCVTVDAAIGVGTGISAIDRAFTIRLLASEESVADSFSRPGHVIPLRANISGSTRRYREPEAAVRLVAAAGLPSAALMATIVGVERPAEVASGAELCTFAELHGLPLVGIDDIQGHSGDQPADHGLSVSTTIGAVSFDKFSESSAEYLCLTTGDVHGQRNVSLTVVAMERLFAEAACGSEPRILVSGPALDRDTDASEKLLNTISRPDSSLRQLLRRLGCRSIIA